MIWVPKQDLASVLSPYFHRCHIGPGSILSIRVVSGDLHSFLVYTGICIFFGWLGVWGKVSKRLTILVSYLVFSALSPRTIEFADGNKFSICSPRGMQETQHSAMSFGTPEDNLSGRSTGCHHQNPRIVGFRPKHGYLILLRGLPG